MKRQVSPTVTWAHHRQTPANFRAVTPQKALAPPQRIAAEDPLADLRQGRGLIDLIEERTLWEMLTRIVWPNGPVCPHCGEKELCYLKEINPDYRGGLGRWQCRLCAEAGDPAI